MFKAKRITNTFVTAALVILLVCSSSVFARSNNRGGKIELAKPSKAQAAFQDLEMGVFIHYGINVYTGQEHGDGKQPPSKFNPTELDVEQWVAAAKAMGANYVCLTARHEGGFCLWPSKTTEYTIANSPYMDGKGDIVRDFVNACRKYNITPGLYHTASHDSYSALRIYKGEIGWGASRDKLMKEALSDKEKRDAYMKIQCGQLKELLTNYGPISVMWADHWEASDPKGVWRAATYTARKYQPEMIYMGPDMWVPGNEDAYVVYPMWNAVNTTDGTIYSRPAKTIADASVKNDYGLLETDANTGHPYGKFWRFRECPCNKIFPHRGWFWHGAFQHTEMALKIDAYYRTVGMGINISINMTPDKRGLIPEKTVASAVRLGAEIKARFSKPVAEITSCKKGNVVELKWDKPCHIDHVITMENIVNGQKVAAYELEAKVDGKWQKFVPRNYHVSPHHKPEIFKTGAGFETIGHKKIDRVNSLYTSHVRFRCTKAVAEPVEIRSFAVYNVYERVLNIEDGQPVYLCDMPYVDVPFTTSNMSYCGVKPKFTAEIKGKKYFNSIYMGPMLKDRRNNPVDMPRATYYLDVLPEKFKTFKTQIALNRDLPKERGSVVFYIDVLRNGKWQNAFTSKVVRGGDIENLEINIENAQAIKLHTDDAGDGNHSDWGVWLEPQLVR